MPKSFHWCHPFVFKWLIRDCSTWHFLRKLHGVERVTCADHTLSRAQKSHIFVHSRSDYTCFLLHSGGFHIVFLLQPIQNKIWLNTNTCCVISTWPRGGNIVDGLFPLIWALQEAFNVKWLGWGKDTHPAPKAASLTECSPLHKATQS